MSRARKRLGWALVFAGLFVVAYYALHPVGQRPDRSFEASVKTPAYTGTHPLLLFDQGHNNAHSPTKGYAPFAKLMRADGCEVEASKGRINREALHGVDVLIIVNADGGSNPKLFGFNLVPLRRGVRGSPAFSADEVKAIQDWVATGGALLLIADHAPFGAAAANLAAAFGVTMHRGFAEVPNQYEGQVDPGEIEFSTENGLLAGHPIISGLRTNEHIHRVHSFTGQSLDGPPGSSILKLPPLAIEQQPVTKNNLGQASDPPAGAAQAVVFEFGKGRVAVLGEAAMLTAQIDQQGHAFGMNLAGLDNRQFALNLVHWLTRVL